MTPGLWFLLIAGACIADLIVGDPLWFPHPVVLMGKLIGFLTKHMNRGEHRRIKGFFMWLMVMLVTAAVIIGLELILKAVNFYLYLVVVFCLLCSCIAEKCLADSVKKASDALKEGNLAEARKYTGYLVGRDTDSLSKEEILRALVETTAENTVDGILAPVFAMLFGLIVSVWIPVASPLLFAMLYKAVNTMDSMVGYIYEPYKEFGHVAAKMDDVFNYIPARIGSYFMLAAGWFLGFNAKNGAAVYEADRYSHKSPNSGHPEAVVAGLLGIRLGGNSIYFGHLSRKPTIGRQVYPIAAKDIDDTISIAVGSEFLLLGLSALAVLIYYAYF